jgi:hypothetical protein
MLAGSPLHDLPESLLTLSREAKHTLAVLDALTQGVRAADRARWNEDAKRLDDRWFADIPAAVRRFGSVRLILPGPFDTLVATIASATPWHWPRPAKPLSAYA